MSAYAKRERTQLADLLTAVGPDEPTLCEGWTTRDLAAHLVVRERRPDMIFGMLIPPLREHAENVRLAKAAEPFTTVVHEVRTPPWWSPISNPLTDELANGIEFFIHHEDVRRAKPGWEPRELDAGEQKAIWRGAQLTGRLALRRAGVPVTVTSDGFGSFTVGENPQVTVTGAPGEVALFVSGRQRAARVEIAGPADLAERLRTTERG
ncbi:TIGR03085 family metal-binding protein [Micromonosporaceae bacterium Da 78-11]